jgi:hypothetical protein
VEVEGEGGESSRRKKFDKLINDQNVKSFHAVNKRREKTSR